MTFGTSVEYTNTLCQLTNSFVYNVYYWGCAKLVRRNFYMEISTYLLTYSLTL
jgi:hypothetical protein